MGAVVKTPALFDSIGRSLMGLKQESDVVGPSRGMNTTVPWCWVELEEVWGRPELGWLVGALQQDNDADEATRAERRQRRGHPRKKRVSTWQQYQPKKSEPP